MEFTGERPLGENELKGSRIRYKTILPYCINRRVLDFGCGVGHGTYFLSLYCPEVTGYDKCSEAIQIARSSIESKNITFIDEIPIFFEDIDLVNAVEVIEHLEKEDLDNQIKMFSTICSTFVGTTPNGDLLYYQPKTIEERRGYHLWHYTYEQLFDLLSKFYKFVEIQGHAFDHSLRAFTGYTFFATNDINWRSELLNKIYLEK